MSVAFELERSRRCSALVLAALSLVACRTEETTVSTVLEHGEWPAPSPGEHGTCADVHELRVCWDGQTPTARPAPLPFPGAIPPDFRCFGASEERRCVRRDRDAPRFVCRGPRCVQSHPRVQSDGEWECADLGGAVLCKGGGRAAGIPPGGRDPAWLCGERAGRNTTARETLCIDPSPDLPDAPGPFRCHFEAEPALARVCEKADDVHGVADGCDAERPCISGLSCTQGHCLPPAPPPTCWLDSDCPGGMCRFGACLEAAP